LALRMDARAAETILREAASGDTPVDEGWEAKVERLSKLCEDGTSKTHIAFLGTSMLAKWLDARADLRAIKPKLAPTNSNAYSARSLCHGVLVPISAELGFSLGVSGREPLNNQPYFRMTRLGDDTPVHARGRAAFDFMVRLVDELQSVGSAAARDALRAFIAVRRRYLRTYDMARVVGAITPDALIVALQRLVSADSEGGRRAQAAVAGLLDVFAGTGRVQSGRVNDPSRHYPGDVAVLAAETAEGGIESYEKAFEVRDKPVRFSDVALFGRTCVDRGVRKVAMVLVSEAQPALDHDEVQRWSERLGVSMTLFLGWEAFAEACLFWASPPQLEAAALAVETIRNRLIEVEASRTAVATWDDLTRPAG
jgi:SacI restriction endonuclease